MKRLFERAKHVVGGEQGASNIEIVVWIVVVLIIAVGLFFLRDRIVDFLGTATDSVQQMDRAIDRTQGSIGW